MDYSIGTNPHHQPFLIGSQLQRTRKALERVLASHGAENITFLRECYGPISFKCGVVGCPRYDAGFETLDERDDHVRSHSRPFKCPQRGCFYEEVGFPNDGNLNRHISLCHTDPAPDKFVFPAFSSPKLPTMDEKRRFRRVIEVEDLDLLQDMIHTNGSLKYQLALNGSTGLHHAAMHGKVASAQLLLDCGSNIGAISKKGTALHVACFRGQTHMVRFLLSNSRRKEDLNAKDSQGNTPLATSLECSRAGLRMAIVRLLLKDGRVSADSKNHDGRTPLSLAAINWRSGTVEVMKMLLEHDGIDVNAKDNEGRTPLSWGASSGMAIVVNTLLEHGLGIDVNSRDNVGRTALFWAVDRQSSWREWGSGENLEAVEVVQIMLQHSGVDVAAKDNEGRTPISSAARAGVVGVVKVLLEHGGAIDANAKDNRGRTPLSFAAARNPTRIWGGDYDPVAVVTALMEHDSVDIDAKDNEGRTPLSWAARTGTVGAVKVLLGHGVGADVNAKDKGGRTPLTWATARGGKDRGEVVNVLVEHGGVGGVL